jgi:hypothetical protein
MRVPAPQNRGNGGLDAADSDPARAMYIAPATLAMAKDSSLDTSSPPAPADQSGKRTASLFSERVH